MVQKNYIGNNGLVTQTLDEIIDDLETSFKDTYGQDINVSQNSPDGQLVNIMAQEKKDSLDLLTQYYNNLDVDRVVGIPQQILYKLNGLTIKAFTYSYVLVNITTTKALNLDAISTADEGNEDAVGYTVSDTNGNRWILISGDANNYKSLSAGTTLCTFRAAQLGNVQALPNTITVMETIVAGVSGVNNPANNFILGGVGESDSEFRLRRNQSMSVPSQGFADSIQSQLLNLTNVTQAKVYQNRTGSAVNGIPAHTIWVVVEGGDKDDIGRVIYNNLPPGIPMKGSETVDVARPNGETETIQYDQPTAIDLYIKAKIKRLGAAIDEDYLKSQLEALRFNIGETVEAANISTEIKNAIGDSGTPYDVEISATGEVDSYSELATPEGLDEFFTIDDANIDITVVI